MANANALTGKQVVGNVEMENLDVVTPNGWNPNAMTPETYASLKYGLEHDGWLANQALLVWGVDDDGAERNIIIDGEHRYRVAKELGFTSGPMVFLSGLSEAKAKALTVGMNHKRGTSDQALLAELLQSIQYEVPDLPENLGLATDDVMKLLAATNASVLGAFEQGTEAEDNGTAPATGAGSVRGNQSVQAPGEFQTFDEDIRTEHQCPKCSYRWSGKSS